MAVWLQKFLNFNYGKPFILIVRVYVMSKQVNKLIDVLHEMVDVFDELMSSAEKKQKQMILLDMNSLERTTAEEGKLLDHVVELEKSSGHVLSEINNVFFKTNSMVLEKLVNVSVDNDLAGANELNKVYKNLLEVTSRLRDINDRNQQLASTSLDMVRDSVRFICKDLKDQDIYQKSGRYDFSGSMLNLLDTQV